MGAKKVLLFSIEKTKKVAIEKLCTDLGWQAEEIPRQRYGEPLGALVGLPVGKASTDGLGSSDRMDGSNSGDQNRARPRIYGAMGFPVEMLV